ncbi:MAG: DUF11 domain-containing protein [Acidimicrobiia bacterium]|nr:DUF11 domain-containing protein [Acidimicrobiia bacterium]
MATETTAASAISNVTPRSDVGFRPIDWWANIDDGAIGSESQRRTPPIPAFVRLSRLVDPGRSSAARRVELDAQVDPFEVTDAPQPPATDEEPASNGGWLETAGRPLFRIGLAAMVAAIVVGVMTFGSSNDDLTTVDSPDAATAFGPGLDGGNTDGVADSTEQAHRVLEALVHQTSAGAEADLSIVGTASANRNEVRWTATVRNTGPETAEGPITVVQSIGSSFELVSVAGTGWDCRHLRAAGSISCEFGEDLAPGQRRRVGLVTSIAGVEPGTRIPSTMSVVAGTADPDLDDNTVNVAAVSAPAGDDERDTGRSPSTGAAGQSSGDADADTTVGATAASNANRTGTAGMEELPRTGSGLAAALGAAGVGLCLAGRRLMTWSSRAQARTLLRAIDID